MKILEISPPDILKQTTACPRKLYAIGNTQLLKEKTSVAIVGSRRATDYGLKNAYKLAKILAERGVVIISGLALGIDAAAHKGALSVKGKTIAVLGSAIDRFEPRTNEPLARKIVESGGLVISEYPKGAETFPANFVFRNRIIAGLSQATIVIEAAERSGALITGNLAVEYNRLVYALPGDVDRLNSKGTNKLIAQGAICLAESDIILEDLNLGSEQQLTLELDDREKAIAALLAEPMSFDKIIIKSKMNPPQALTVLLNLELKGAVQKNQDGCYLLTPDIDFKN